MLAFGTKAHHALHTGAVVPRAVKEDDLATGWEVFNIALEVPGSGLTRRWLLQSHSASTTRVQVLVKALNGATLAGRVAPPVSQGLIQSLGVFIDTIIVCTATAFVILIAGPDVWGAEGVNPANLTTLAVANELGNWTIMPMAVLIFVLAYSSIIAAYVYSETNMTFVTDSKVATWVVRVISVASVVIGALASLDLVWNSVDIAMAIMTVTNLVALLWLSKWGLGALRDFEKQRKEGVGEPVFIGEGNPLLPGDVPTDSWSRAAVLSETR